MAAPTTLSPWPPELFNSMARFLPLEDLRKLRLVSKAIAALVAQGAFKQYYRTKHVDVSPEALAEFVAMTQPGLVGAMELENLVLTGLAVDTEHLERIVKDKARWETEGHGPMFCSTQHKLSPAELEKAEMDLEGLRCRKVALEEFHCEGWDVEMLKEAFESVAACGRRGKLMSLKLEVALLQEELGKKLLPIQTRSRDAVWRAAKSTFRAVMGGLAGSAMPLAKLDVVTGQWHCSLGVSALERVEQLQEPGLRRALGSLESLSLSLSADFNTRRDESDEDSDHNDENPRSGLADFLALCPSLKHLHLHWFRLRSALPDNHAGDNLLKPVVHEKPLSTLTSLTLRGLRFQDTTLLDLFHSASIKELRLENITITDPTPLPADLDDESDPEVPSPANQPPPAPLTSDAWTQIFAHCTSATAGMKALYFEDLWGSRLRHFTDVPDSRAKMPWTPRAVGCETLEFKGVEAAREKIRYAYARGRPLGSPQAYRWRVGREREYGPA